MVQLIIFNHYQKLDIKEEMKNKYIITTFFFLLFALLNYKEKSVIKEVKVRDEIDDKEYIKFAPSDVQPNNDCGCA